MTRFLERDKRTQVNSNLIGVQVRPQVVPPIYEVNALTANVGMNVFECTSTSNFLPMLYVNSGSGDEIWAYTGTQEEYNGTVYNVWSCVMGSEQGVNFLTDSNDSITDQTQFYVHLDEPDAPPVKPTFVSEYMLNYGGDLYHFDPNADYWYVTDDSFVQSVLGGDATCDLVDGFFISKGNGRYLGQFTGTITYNNEDFYFEYYGDDNGYSMWRLDYYGEIYLYSSIRDPYIGYNLVSNNVGTEAYTSRVTMVFKKEVDPGYTEDIDCKVEYSVDGETWTACEENLTDDNNVIANIPRYMYLKFGQDVEITEE